MHVAFKIGKYHFRMATQFLKLEGKAVAGITNRTKDGKYIPFLDYDYKEIDWITDELKALQEMFNLSTFYLFSTKKGYHAICLDKVPLSTFVSILRNSSVDVNYINIPLKYGAKVWTLRATKKEELPIFYGDLAASSDNEKSLAHVKILHKLYPSLSMSVGKTDNHEQLILAKYQV